MELHILTNGKYYFFSIVFHIIVIMLVSLPFSAWENSLQKEAGDNTILKVSFNKNYQTQSPAVNIFDNQLQKRENIPDNIVGSSKNDFSENTLSESKESDIAGVVIEKSGGADFSFFKKALAISNITPDYPAYAVKKGIEGTVLLDVNIDTFGNVAGIKIVTSSNYNILDKAAVDCIRKAKFIPAAYMGNHVEDILRIAINFYLKK